MCLFHYLTLLLSHLSYVLVCFFVCLFLSYFSFQIITGFEIFLSGKALRISLSLGFLSIGNINAENMVWSFLTKLYGTGNLNNKFQKLMEMNINANKNLSLNVTLTVRVVFKYAQK